MAMHHNPPDVEHALSIVQQRVELQLQRFLPNSAEHLHQAMRYAVLNGGKRLRPLLVYATGICLGVPLEQLDHPAIAVELIHCYSLVHDDLPAMDDDDLRRGKPTCHKAFDEATAILVGDALQSLAFEVLSSTTHLAPSVIIAMFHTLARASGAEGMAGGQSLDLLAERKTLMAQQIEHLHQLKTGALIQASVRLGALAAVSHDTEILSALDRYAQTIGLAFQIKDDLLDVEGTTAQRGKSSGHDEALFKATYPSTLGMEETKIKLQQLKNDAHQALQHVPDSALLELLCLKMIERDH